MGRAQGLSEDPSARPCAQRPATCALSLTPFPQNPSCPILPPTYPRNGRFPMQDKIIIKGAREHNLKNISLELPRNKMIVFTGLSGSGKSSLAFDTIFAEGQRRYVESLSAYARQFLGQMAKPDVDEIEGLSPAISIDQKAHSANPRSTVATITEIYDYLRVLYARVGHPYCPVCSKPIQKLTAEQIVDAVLKRTADIHSKPEEIKKRKGKFTNEIVVMAPAVRGRKGEYHQLLQDFYHDGFLQARVDGQIVSLRDRIALTKFQQHTIELVVDRVPLGWPVEQNKQLQTRLAEAVESALERGNDTVNVVLDDGSEMLLSARFSCADDGFAFPEIEPRLFSFNSPYGACSACNGLGTKELFSEEVCPACNGARLRTEALHVLVGGKNIVDATGMDIQSAYDLLTNLKLTETETSIAEPVLREIGARLKFLLDVGLHYLTLARKAGSSLEPICDAKRIRCASPPDIDPAFRASVR